MSKLSDQTLELLSKEYLNISGLAIAKDGKIAYEYFARDSEKDAKIHVASVTKSVFSILVGIALEKQYIKSIHEKIISYFPDLKISNRNKTLSQLEIKHLLTMTAPYKFRSEPYSKVFSTQNWGWTALQLLGGIKPIGEFHYTTIGIQVLSSILEQTTQMNINAFATKYLFTPLRIIPPETLPIDSRETYFKFIKNHYSNGWAADPQGTNTSGWGLMLSVHDLLKIGQLYLQNGQWEGKSIVSSQWVEESTTTHSFWENKPYGYLWWILDDETFAAIGDGGNIIYVNRSKNLVIGIVSHFVPRFKDRIDFIENHLIPIYNL